MEITDKETTGVEGVEQEIIDQVLADDGTDKGTGTEQQASQTSTTQTAAATTPQQTTTQPATAPAAQGVQTPPPGYVPYDALHAERQQRQQLQQQVTQLMQQFTDLQKLQSAKPAAADQSTDPLAAMIAQQLERVVPQFMTPIQQMQQQFQQMQQQQAFQQRVMQSDARARAKYPDYDQVTAPILTRAQQDPVFAKTIMAMPDPGEYAYLMALGMQAQTQRVATGQEQTQKMQQMATMPRSSQIQTGGGGSVSQFNNLEDMVDHFDQLTPAQQDRLLKMTRMTGA